MTTTRSTALWQLELLTKAAINVYTVPAGFHTILKSVGFWSASGSPVPGVEMFVTTPAGVTVQFIKLDLEPFANFWWAGWIVLTEGDNVRVTFPNGPIHSWGSGAELSL